MRRTGGPDDVTRPPPPTDLAATASAATPRLLAAAAAAAVRRADAPFGHWLDVGARDADAGSRAPAPRVTQTLTYAELWVSKTPTDEADMEKMGRVDRAETKSIDLVEIDTRIGRVDVATLSPRALRTRVARTDGEQSSDEKCSTADRLNRTDPR